MIDFSNQIMETEEVYLSSEKGVFLDAHSINDLINLAKNTKRNRVRFCAHKAASEKIHEMFIVHPRDAYVRPHKHIDKTESILILSGCVDFIEFYDNGEIKLKKTLGTISSGEPFYRKIEPGVFHTLLIKSEWVVFLEITQGPFDKNQTVFADWSPDPENEKEISKLYEYLKESKSNLYE